MRGGGQVLVAKTTPIFNCMHPIDIYDYSKYKLELAFLKKGRSLKFEDKDIFRVVVVVTLTVPRRLLSKYVWAPGHFS